MDAYRDAMQLGKDRYEGVLSVLNDKGWRTYFTQTGGMCAALEVRLEAGVLLVTDASEELPWDPAELRGWGVGFYSSSDFSEGPVEYVEDDNDTSTVRLLALVEECLASVARSASSVR